MDLKFNYEEFFNKIDKIENIESIIYKQTSGFDLYLLCTFCSKFFELICEDKINRIKYSDLDISFSGKKFGFDEDEFAFLNDCSILHYNSYYLENKKLIKKKIYIKFELIEVVDINYFNCLYNSLYLIERIILNNTKPENSEPIQKVEIEPEAIDLSDTTATEKIIYLQKLGVIDFLRTKQPFNTSINSLATVISAITGVKPETKHIQSMLNPMISKEVGQKNNPLNSKNTVSKVEKQLINIGFNLNETI